MDSPTVKPQHRRSERQIRIVFGSAFAFGVAMAVISLLAVRGWIRSLSDVAFEDATALIDGQKLRISSEVKGRSARSFLITGDEQDLDRMSSAGSDFKAQMSKLRASTSDPEQHEALDKIRVADREYQAALDRVVEMRRGSSTVEGVRDRFELEVQPAREQLSRAISDLSSSQEHRLRDATKTAKESSSFALKVLGAMAGAGFLASGMLTFFLARALGALSKQREETACHLVSLGELNTELDAFAGRVAHDLRNLITPMSLIAARLRQPDKASSTTAPMADRLQRTVDRSLAMLDGLLAFSKSNEPDPRAASSVASVVDEVIEQLAPLARQVDATIECDIEDGVVACSRELLNVVVLNLVGNALKFLEGRQTRRVHIQSHAGERICELRVTDTGPGIPGDALPRICEPFYRVPGTKVAGAGIGLATVQRIVQAHRGRVRVESEPGRGATFHVELPLAAGLPDSIAPSVDRADRSPVRERAAALDSSSARSPH